MSRFLRFALGGFVILLLMSFAIACGAGKAPTPTQQQGGNPTTAPQPTAARPTIQAQPTTVVVPAPPGIKTNHPAGIEYLDAVHMTEVVNAKKAPMRTTPSGATKVCMITWGADEATVLANGDRTTQQGSPFAREGLKIELCREDNPVRAVEKVISGETPYLRGTKDMISDTLEVLKEQGIEMVEIYLLSRSTGGDTMVCRNDMVKTAADLKGRYVGLQLYGPHMYYLARIVKDAGLTMGDIKIRWLRELTIPSYDTKGVAVDPMSAMQRDPTLACVMVISPDMMALTSGGNVGTGAESSVKGAFTLITTKDGPNIIYDVYVVRKDYLDAHRAEVQKFVHGLMVATEEQIDLFNQQTQRQTEYRNFVRIASAILRDNEQLTADIEGMYADMTFAKYAGNIQFYSGQGATRTFDVLTRETQEALIGYGLLSGYVTLDHAHWDYAVLAQGLRDTAGVTVPKFDPVKVQQYVATERVSEQAGVHQFPIYFGAGEVDFSTEQYKADLDKVIEWASVYSGALIVIEAHVDPGHYNTRKQSNDPAPVLASIKQSAAVQSEKRARAAHSAIIARANERGVAINSSQFTILPLGFEKAVNPNTISPDASGGKDPDMVRKRAENRRVIVKIIRVTAELEE